MSRLTLRGPAEFFQEVRKSRFLARADAVADVEAAARFVRDESDPQASHSCWAYRIEATYRFHDAGEPAGTAGRPILQAIDTQGLDHVAVVVIRHFGGIKLGAGGLARAYGGTAAECLRRAAKVSIVEWVEYEIQAAFGDSGAVHQCLDASGAQRLGETFDADGLRVRVRIGVGDGERLRERLRDATRGRAQVTMPTA